ASVLSRVRAGEAAGITAESPGAAGAAPSRRRAQGPIRRWWARIHHRPPSEATPVTRAADAVPERTATRQPRTGARELLTGTYLTDDRSLFRVEYVHTDRRSDKMFVELENCTTLELIACPVDDLFERPLRSVTPGGRSEPGNAAAA